MMTVYSAPNTRAIRVIWVLEEIGATAEIRSMPYPPRRHAPDYFAVNPTGMVPLLMLLIRRGYTSAVGAAKARQPMSLRLKPFGQSTCATVA